MPQAQADCVPFSSLYWVDLLRLVVNSLLSAHHLFPPSTRQPGEMRPGIIYRITPVLRYTAFNNLPEPPIVSKAGIYEPGWREKSSCFLKPQTRAVSIITKIA